MPSRAQKKSSARKALPVPILRLADDVGRFMEYWGFKGIHGKMWVLAFLSEKPVETRDFIENLGVSKALVSLSLKDLLQYRVFLESSSGPRGRRSYVCNPNIVSVILNVLREREYRLLGEIRLAQEHARQVPADALGACGFSVRRIDEVGEMVSEAQKLLRAMIGLGSIDLGGLAATLSFDSLNSGGGGV